MRCPIGHCVEDMFYWVAIWVVMKVIFGEIYDYVCFFFEVMIVN